MNTTEQIQTNGWAGPVRILSEEALEALRHHLKGLDLRKDAAWSKDLAVRDRVIFDLAQHPTLLSVITPLLGENIILWGAQVVQRTPGQAHAWHSDLEVWDARAEDAVSVWIGVEGTSDESSLHFISETQTLGISVQEAGAHLERDQRTGEAMLELAHQHLPNAELCLAGCRDGDAAFFAGGTWHGSLNLSDAPRTALLLQYARADYAIRQPDWSQLDWPFRFVNEPLPPTISIRGKGGKKNQIVSPPPAVPTSMWDDKVALKAIAPSAQAFDLPLKSQPGRGWSPTRFFEGFTEDLRKLSGHASTLLPGHCPHPPHGHFEEEVLVVLRGRGEVVWAEGPDDPDPQTLPCQPGDLHYYPAYTFHTIQNPSENTEPLEYLMFRWASAPDWAQTQPLLQRHQYPSVFAPDARFDKPEGFHSQLLFEGPTRHLNKLHAHLSWVFPGAGYEAHIDDYDVAILLMQGAVETLGKTVHAPALLFHPMGTLHGLKATGNDPAHYLVLEFHGQKEPRPQDRLVDRLKRFFVRK